VIRIEPTLIEDATDPRLADYVDLADPDLRRRVETAGRFFVAESPLVVRRLLRSGRPVRSVLVTPDQQAALADVLTGVAFPVYVAPIDVLRRVVGFDLHRGAVAAADRWPLPAVADVLAKASLLAVCERVNDHENLGVLFRSAAALGLDAILLDAECADPLYRRTVRVSIGHAITLPWTRLSSLAELEGFTTVALTPAPDAIELPAFSWPARAAVLLGAEGPGLSDEWLGAADARVRIPMDAGADSLNVATAASIAFYAAGAASNFSRRSARRS
jgi:tRNA G18 (ribose-2'-O)-methylase SpoU